MIGFGQFGKRNLGIGSTGYIVSLTDTRLVEIDPTSDGFFANVLEYDAEDEDLRSFIEAIREVKEAIGKFGKFWKPIYDPYLEDEWVVVFKAQKKTAIGHSFKYWQKKSKEMPTVDGKHWSVGSEYQYYAFLVWLINQLVKKGWKINKALRAVVIDSKELGHYLNSKSAQSDFEKTGSRPVCGVCDLGNTRKILSCANQKASGFWVAGGDCHGVGDDYPLAALDYCDDYYVDIDFINCVGWLVLS